MICPQCNGSGFVHGAIHLNYGNGRGEWLNEYTCLACKGTGEVDDEHGKRVALGDQFRKFRISLCLSMREFAEIKGIPPIELNRMERGVIENGILSAWLGVDPR